MTPEEKDIQVNIIGVVETAMSFRKVSLYELSKNCDISSIHLQRIFDCKRKVDFILLAKIQKALNIKFEVRAIQ